MIRQTELEAVFASPPAAFRSMPQWSWNGDMTRERITEQLAQFAAQGCGGLFAHARPGHNTGYLSDKFLDLWRFALDTAARLGMAFHIYDEFMCPAGHAGGLVTAEKPHLAVQELTLVARAGLARNPPAALGVWRAEGEGADRRVVKLTDAEARTLTPNAPAWAMVMAPQAAQARYGGHPFPDLLRRETADAFIASTHERYAAVAGETFASAYDGSPGARDSGVRFMFCDEPMLVGSGGLPLSREVLRHFRADHGYDLLDHMPALAWGSAAAYGLPPLAPPGGGRTGFAAHSERRRSQGLRSGARPDARAVRFDYWWTVNRLLNEAFMHPMADWCAAHDLLFTGHLMEHEWPSPRSHASAMASLRWMQAPGTDLLGFQYATTTPAENGIYLLNLVELRSVKRQLGREWMLVETCGGGGYGRAFDLFKPLEDLVLAYGFNVIDPHLSAQTVAGIRKYDWPQTLSDHSPWWEHYRHQADHVARVNTALCQGQDPGARVLVLHPTTTGWLHYTAPVFEKVAGALADADAAALEDLRQSQVDLVLALMGAQIDFDLGDEMILEELGRVEDGEMVIGPGSPLQLPPMGGKMDPLVNTARPGGGRYDMVVVPEAMETWTASTLDQMTAYLESGGRVIALSRPDGTSAPPLVNGRPSSAPRRLSERFPDQWTVVDGAEAAAWSLRETDMPPLTAPDGSALPAGLVWRRTLLEDGTWLWFFCNPWAELIVTEVWLPGRSLRVMDTTTGETGNALLSITPLGRQPAEEPVGWGSRRPEQERRAGLVARLDLPPRAHALWWVSEDGWDDPLQEHRAAAQDGDHPARPSATRAVVQQEQEQEEVELTLRGIERLGPNLLMLDYCDVVVGRREELPPLSSANADVRCGGRSGHHLATDEAMWHAMGFDGNPWQGSHQFKRTLIDHPVDPESAVRITYRFVVDPALLEMAREDLHVGVERPWLYEVSLNGEALDVECAPRWFDEDARALAIGEAVCAGENVLTLTAQPFHMLCEVTPVYVIGDFALLPAARGFTIGPSTSPKLGDWTQQGMGFYPGKLRYSFSFALDAVNPLLELCIPDWAGSVVAVSLDEVDAGVVAHQPYALALHDVAAGAHTLRLDVVGNMRNMMGPHHSDGLPGRWTWANAPRDLPPGSTYDRWPSGLLAMPKLRVL